MWRGLNGDLVMSHGENAETGTPGEQQPVTTVTEVPTGEVEISEDLIDIDDPGIDDADDDVEDFEIEASEEPADEAGSDGDDQTLPEDGTDRDGESPAEATVADLEQEGEIAADYVEALLDIADLDGDIDMDVEGERAMVSVVGGTLDELIGAKGEVLDALQELTRLAVQRQTGLRTRMMLDVGGYRARRREELTEVGQDAAREVSQTGTPKRLAAMTAFERKVVHDAIAAAGLRSESEGEDPNRRVVVYPAG
jgi:spoIIIJ-associated protein